MRDLLCVCNPLLSLHAECPQSLLDKYGLTNHSAVQCEERHKAIFPELVQNFKVEFSLGGSGQVTGLVAQSLSGEKHSVSFIGSVGKDEAGSRLKELQSRAGLRTLFSETDDQATGWCAVVQAKKNEGSKEGEGLGPPPGEDEFTIRPSQSIVSYSGATSQYKLDHLRFKVWEFVEKSQIVYVTSFFLMVSPDSVTIIAEHCAKMGKLFCINLSAPFLCEFFREKLFALLPYADYIFGNEAEYVKFAEKMWEDEDHTNVEEIAAKMARLPQTDPRKRRYVVITNGANPTIVASTWQGHGVKIQKYPVPPVKNGKLVCKEGAGDAFAGGFLYGLMRDANLDTCMQAALYAAQVSVQRQGPRFDFRDKPSGI